MKLRLARKIYARIGTADEARYTGHQTGRAIRRVEKTASHKGLEAWWRGVVRETHEAAANGCPSAIRLLEECRRRTAKFFIDAGICARCAAPLGKDDEGWPGDGALICTDCWEKESAEAWHEFVSATPAGPP
jgi:hypothetical protein